MNNRESTLLRPALRAVMLLFLSVVTHCSYAQNPTVRSYFTNYDLKNYSTEIIPSGATGQGVVMGGTYFGPAGAAGNPNYTHFIRTDNDGVVNPGGVWTFFQEDGAEDERCVDIATDESNPNRYFLTSLVRLNNSGNYHDHIKVYEVDYNGVLLNSALIESVPTGGNMFTNLYPIHSLYDDVSGALFICGYALGDVNLSIADKEGPTYHGINGNRWNKEAFVMKVDPVTLAVLNYERYNYAYTPAGIGGGLNYNCPSFYNSVYWNPVNQPTSLWGDFDMAMRLTKLQGGNIHVTGSATALHFQCSVPPNPYPTPAPSNPIYGCQNTLASAVMNVIIDPFAAPNTIMLIRNEPFVDEEYDFSFGTGIFQNGSSYYLLGNHYTPEIRTGAGIDDEGGFEPYMHGMFFANLDNAGGPMPRYNPDPATLYNTGLNPPYNPPGTEYSLIAYGPRSGQVENWSVTNIAAGAVPVLNDVCQWVAGYRANSGFTSSAGCSHAYPPSFANVTPSLSLWDLGWNVGTGIAATIRTTKDHMTQFGTGPDVYGANSYRQLGEGLSNIGWPPTFAIGDEVTNPGSPDIIMAVPIYAGSLNLKFIRANRLDGSVVRNNTDYCPNSVEECAPPLELPSHVLYPEGIDMSRNYTVLPWPAGNPLSRTNTLSLTLPTEIVCDAINNVYKPGKTTTITGVVQNADNTVVYPNPAQQYVQVALAKNIGAEQAIKVELTGVQGQVLSVLYEGNAAGLSADRQLQLTGLAAGLYFVQVYADGQPVCNQKLNVMQ